MAINKQSQKAILQTLYYADVFNYPLTAKEIHDFLIHKSKTSLSSINIALSQLQKKRVIGKSRDYFFLKNRKKLINKRQQRTKFSKQKTNIAKKVSRWLRIIPSVKMVAITGALAMKNAKKQDDIDLMIITSQNQLWLTRLIVMLFVSVVAKRRKPATRKPQPSYLENSICLNLFLDETALAVPPKKRNLYTAHEIAQIKPLINKNNTYQKFLTQNSWIVNYLPNIKIIKKQKNTLLITSYSLLSTLNFLAFKLQLLYMKPKMTSETVTVHSAFFHPRATNRLVLKKYKNRLKKFIP